MRKYYIESEMWTKNSPLCDCSKCKHFKGITEWEEIECSLSKRVLCLWSEAADNSRYCDFFVKKTPEFIKKWEKRLSVQK